MRCSPEGPGTHGLHVSYTNGSSSGVVPGCQKIASLTCTHTGVPYDGLVYTYTVVAANSARRRCRQPVAAQCGYRHRGRGSARPPGGACTAVATGNEPGGAAPVHRAGLPRHRRAGSRSSSAGWSYRSLQQQTGSNVTTRVQVPSNEQSSPGPAARVQREGPGGVHAQRAAERPDLRPSRRKARRHRADRRQRQGRSLDHHRHQQRRPGRGDVPGAGSTAAPTQVINVPAERGRCLQLQPITAFTDGCLRAGAGDRS